MEYVYKFYNCVNEEQFEDVKNAFEKDFEEESPEYVDYFLSFWVPKKLKFTMMSRPNNFGSFSCNNLIERIFRDIFDHLKILKVIIFF